MDKQVLKVNHPRFCLPLIAIIMLAALTGCNRNDGDIGDLYGEWMLQSMTVDGEQADLVCSDYVWRFQSNVVCITLKLPHHEFQSYFGSWRRDDRDRLAIDYGYAPPGASFSPFFPPPGMRLSPDNTNVLTVHEYTYKELELYMTDTSGAQVIYRLRRVN